MQIKTKETVQNTLNKYCWDNAQGWHKNPLTGTLVRDVYQKGNLAIRQEIQSDRQAVFFETPEYTMAVSQGVHPDMMTIAQSKNVPFYSLSIFTTNSDKNVYNSFTDDVGYMNIGGDRQFLFHFLEKLPDAYFVLDKDEEAQHISSCWMRPRNIAVRSKVRHRFIDKERE